MALQPEKVKYRKMHRGSRTGLATRGNTVAFGEYGLMALERCWMDGKQLEACRVAITRHMKRKGKMWIRVFPAEILHEEAAGNPHGQGQGAAGRLGGGHPSGEHFV